MGSIRILTPGRTGRWLRPCTGLILQKPDGSQDPKVHLNFLNTLKSTLNLLFIFFFLFSFLASATFPRAQDQWKFSNLVYPWTGLETGPISTALPACNTERQSDIHSSLPSIQHYDHRVFNHIPLVFFKTLWLLDSDVFFQFLCNSFWSCTLDLIRETSWSL